MIPIHPCFGSNGDGSLSVQLPNKAVSTCIRQLVSCYACVVLISPVKTNYANWQNYNLEIRKNDTDDVLLEAPADSSQEPSVVSSLFYSS